MQAELTPLSEGVFECPSNEGFFAIPNTCSGGKKLRKTFNNKR